MSKFNLYSLLSLLYGEDSHLFREAVDLRKPAERRELLKRHFKEFETAGVLDLDVDDSVLRGLCGMQTGKSRGGTVGIRKSVVSALTQGESYIYDRHKDSTYRLTKDLLDLERFDEFSRSIKEYMEKAAKDEANIKIFGQNCLDKIKYSLFRLLENCRDKDPDRKYRNCGDSIAMLFLSTLLQDRARDVTFLFSEREEPLRPGFIEKLELMNRNVCIMDKEDAEDPTNFPFYERMFDARALTMLAFAGTSFITGLDVSIQYASSDPFKEVFREKLLAGEISAKIILVNPFSPAGADSVRKMRPHGGGYMPSKEIILHNIKELFSFRKRNPEAKVELFLTDLCLPYGILFLETNDDTRSYMKIDTYDPELPSDYKRKSMYLYSRDPETKELYRDYRNVLEAVKKISTPIKNGSLDFGWIKNTAIIHRGRIRPDIKEHCLTGFYECMKDKAPMELDILFLKDGKAILGRDATIMNKSTGITFPLSSLTLNQLRSMKDKDYCLSDGRELPFLLEQTMLLSEALSLINGTVPIILELKAPYDEEEASLAQKVETVTDILRYYNNGYNFAIHSANPWFLAMSKKSLPLIPHGIITWDFDGLEDKVSEEYLSLHRNLGFTSEDCDEFIDPDFISAGINNDVFLEKATAFARKRNIPLLVWTIKNRGQEFLPQVKSADSIIIEGGKSFGTFDAVHPEAAPDKAALLSLAAEILSIKSHFAPEIQISVRQWLATVATEDEEKTAVKVLIPSLMEGIHAMNLQQKTIYDFFESENGSLSYEEKQKYIENFHRLHSASKKMLDILIDSINDGSLLSDTTL